MSDNVEKQMEELNVADNKKVRRKCEKLLSFIAFEFFEPFNSCATFRYSK